MSIFDRRPRLRWAVPAVAAALIVAGTAAGSFVASADSGLPERSAQDLLVDLQTPNATAVSGTVVTSADLGLPALPMGRSAGAAPTALVTGSHTLRVWSNGPTLARVAMIGNADEYDIVRNGSDVWAWSSADKTAVHYSVPQKQSAALPDAATAGLPSTPQEAAALALASLDETTAVTTSGVAKVAGRDAYELILAPKQADTLVAQVVIAIDAQTHVPLRVQVYSKQIADPAFEVGFSSVDFSAPDASVFDFTPPPGATVTEHATPDGTGAQTGQGSDIAGSERPTVVGSGWSQVVIGTVPADMADASKTADGAQGAQALALLQALPTESGTWGSGHVLSGTLFSAIITDDGRFAVGAVSPDVLGAALAAK